MNSGFIVIALTAVSIFTSLTVEGLKKVFNEIQLNYSSNIMAAITSIVLSVAVMAGYMVYTGEEWTPQAVVTMIALAFLSFLSATTSFDKVVQAIEQIKRMGE